MFESSAPKYKFGGFGGSNENVAAKPDPKPNREFRRFRFIDRRFLDRIAHTESWDNLKQM
jgi:hypothetical protein